MRWTTDNSSSQKSFHPRAYRPGLKEHALVLPWILLHHWCKNWCKPNEALQSKASALLAGTPPGTSAQQKHGSGLERMQSRPFNPDYTSWVSKMYVPDQLQEKPTFHSSVTLVLIDRYMAPTCSLMDIRL